MLFFIGLAQLVAVATQEGVPLPDMLGMLEEAKVRLTAMWVESEGIERVMDHVEVQYCLERWEEEIRDARIKATAEKAKKLDKELDRMEGKR